MPLSITELFGHAPDDMSEAAQKLRQGSECPFVDGKCIKRFKSGLISGACTLKPTTSGPVICCPNRLYADNYQVLLDVAVDAFGKGMRLCRKPSDAMSDGNDVVVFGKHWGKELRLPNRVKGGSYFIDWILVRLGPDNKLQEFVAVEVQTMDTTGSYEAEAHRLLKTGMTLPNVQSNINWENVSKRILPQLIFKGHVLRQEPLCKKGMYFICPSPVYQRIITRLGGTLRPYHPQPGSLTLRHYDLGKPVAAGKVRTLEFGSQLTTTVDQIALAFTAPSNLPEPGVYEQAIRSVLGSD